MEMKLLRRNEVLDRCAISSTTLHRLIEAGQFPPAVTITSRRVAWVEHEVENWIACRINQARRE
ncbi:AlpA family phage regulatory protein [Halomonas sp. JS92-SW72]|uniref:helix-turn-helix transcriptional regulator n=1 Tax=Halomonas sp. JS92-SW72 TaxID=2306583 RepID=UPI001F091621|nr:AlpA family phage regulatory protein [Halomonas sp. JS92-SW72]